MSAATLGAAVVAPDGIKRSEYIYAVRGAWVLADVMMNLPKLGGFDGWLFGVLGSTGFFGITGIGRMLLMHANNREDIKEAYAGDIVALAGLKETRTGDTLCDTLKPVILERMEFPEPVIEIAIEPKSKADQEKMGTALQRLVAEMYARGLSARDIEEALNAAAQIGDDTLQKRSRGTVVPEICTYLSEDRSRPSNSFAPRQAAICAGAVNAIVGRSREIGVGLSFKF